MDARVAGCGLVLLMVMAGCASQPAGSDPAAQPAAAGTEDALHKEGFEAGTAAVSGDVDEPEVSREGFEAGVTSTEIPVPTATPAPGAPPHSSR